MTTARFNELLASLEGPDPKFTVLRLVLALRVVVSDTGEAGDHAFEDFCARGVTVASRGESIVIPIEAKEKLETLLRETKPN